MAHILVVDDSDSLCFALALVLRDGGHIVSCVPDGDWALRAVTADRFDVMILDLHLPGMHGLEVLSALRRHGHQMPVLILSAAVDDDTRARALALGAAGVLTKSGDAGELLGAVSAACRTPRASGSLLS